MSEQFRGGEEKRTFRECLPESRVGLKYGMKKIKKKTNYLGPLGRSKCYHSEIDKKLDFSNGQVDSNMTQGQCYQGNKAKGIMLSRVSALKNGTYCNCNESSRKILWIS